MCLSNRFSVLRSLPALSRYLVLTPRVGDGGTAAGHAGNLSQASTRQCRISVGRIYLGLALSPSFLQTTSREKW